jgi:hypothetical protein
MPGYPPGPVPAAGPTYSPGYPAPAFEARDGASCRAEIAHAAYPVVNQLLYYTALGNMQPTGPLGRPPLVPAPAYPGFGTVYGFGGPEFLFGSGVLAGSVGGLALNPPQPGAAELIANGFSAANLRQSAIANNLSAADANARYSLHPRVQADHLTRVVTALLTYYDIACPLFAEAPVIPASTGAPPVNGSEEELRRVIREELQRVAEEILRRQGPPGVR